MCALQHRFMSFFRKRLFALVVVEKASVGVSGGRKARQGVIPLCQSHLDGMTYIPVCVDPIDIFGHCSTAEMRTCLRKRTNAF